MQSYCCAKTWGVQTVLYFLLRIGLMVDAFELDRFSDDGFAVPEKRLSELLYGHFGTGYHCIHNGRYILHGHVFKTSACLASRCFFGTSFIHSEGCEDSSGQCHEVNSVWTERCVSYKCKKTSKKGYNYYQPVVQLALCRDVHGQCHRPGETFSVGMEEQIHHNCQCHIKNTMIFYRCVLSGNTSDP